MLPFATVCAQPPVVLLCSLTTPPIVHFGLACVQFFYYMWGVDVDELTVATHNLGVDYSWLTLEGPHRGKDITSGRTSPRRRLLVADARRSSR